MSEEEKAINTLKFVIPLLERYHFRWVITGGFASYLYGVKRPITDIDIDIYTSKNSLEFKSFLKDLEKYTTEPLNHFVDQNYDNYNFEINKEGIVVDFCPMTEMLICNKQSKRYEPFYTLDFPDSEVIKWNGLTLPLLSKQLVIKNKEMLVWQRESDITDISGLRALK